MAATRAYTTARYTNRPAGCPARPQTYFTKYLADVVERGIPGQPARLQLDPLFRQVRDNLAADHHPVPESRAVDNAREFVFAYNAAPPATQHDPEQELAQRDAQVAALLEQGAAHERELARLRAWQAESPPATTERREELREAIHEAERETGEAVRQLDEAREAASPVPRPAEVSPEPPVPHPGVLRGLAIRAAIVTVVLGGAIAGLVIALSGGNHLGGFRRRLSDMCLAGAIRRHPAGGTNGNPANIVTVLASRSGRRSSSTTHQIRVAFGPGGDHSRRWHQPAK